MDCRQVGPARGWKQAMETDNGKHQPHCAKQTSLTIIPPAPGKHLPFIGNCQDVRRTTGHLHHLIAQQGLHDLGLAGEEQQPLAETSQPARLLPSLPPCPPSTAQHWQHPSFHPTQTPEDFFVLNSLQRVLCFVLLKSLRARSTKDNANISGAEESSQHDGLESRRVGICPPAHVGSARGG